MDPDASRERRVDPALAACAETESERLDEVVGRPLAARSTCALDLRARAAGERRSLSSDRGARSPLVTVLTTRIGAS
jgi:hypothetical protein